MNKYESMSDFEINRAVAIMLGFTTQAADDRDGAVSLRKNSIVWRNADYCNNPSDAWPVIVENEITLIDPVSAGTDGWMAKKWWPKFGKAEIEIVNLDPLVAAMIVFLMMGDE